MSAKPCKRLKLIEKLGAFYKGKDAHSRGFGLMVNPYRRGELRRALWESGWLTMDRRMR